MERFPVFSSPAGADEKAEVRTASENKSFSHHWPICHSSAIYLKPSGGSLLSDVGAGVVKTPVYNGSAS